MLIKTHIQCKSEQVSRDIRDYGDLHLIRSLREGQGQHTERRDTFNEVYTSIQRDPDYLLKKSQLHIKNIFWYKLQKRTAISALGIIGPYFLENIFSSRSRYSIVSLT